VRAGIRAGDGRRQRAIAGGVQHGVDAARGAGTCQDARQSPLLEAP
jgi:hypothetical protein